MQLLHLKSNIWIKFDSSFDFFIDITPKPSGLRRSNAFEFSICGEWKERRLKRARFILQMLLLLWITKIFYIVFISICSQTNIIINTPTVVLLYMHNGIVYIYIWNLPCIYKIVFSRLLIFFKTFYFSSVSFRDWYLWRKRNNSIFRADNVSVASGQISFKHQVHDYY